MFKNNFERAVENIKRGTGQWLIFFHIDLSITLAYPSIVRVRVQHAIIIAWNDLESVSLSSSARTDMVATLCVASGRTTTRCISVITITPSCLSTIRNNTHEYRMNNWHDKHRFTMRTLSYYTVNYLLNCWNYHRNCILSLCWNSINWLLTIFAISFRLSHFGDVSAWYFFKNINIKL